MLHLLVQIQQWKHQNNGRNLFKFNSIHTTTTTLTPFSFLGTGFAEFFSLTMGDFEQVNAGRVITLSRKNAVVFFACLNRPYHFRFFNDCLPQIFRFLYTLFHMSYMLFVVFIYFWLLGSFTHCFLFILVLCFWRGEEILCAK